MENNKNKRSVKFQGDILNFCDFIQVFVFTTNHHLKLRKKYEVNPATIKFIAGYTIRFLYQCYTNGKKLVCAGVSISEICSIKGLSFWN